MSTTGRPGLISAAQEHEKFGFDTLLYADHLITGDPALTLQVMADHTSCRIGSYVMCTDFHHPVVLGRMCADLDEFTDGRFEIGLGAGYWAPEYAMAGIPFMSGPKRMGRLKEATEIILAMMSSEPASFTGRHFSVAGLATRQSPRQQPRPPLLLGGGGPKLLAWAAKTADIVALNAASAPGGGLRVSTMTKAALQERVALVRAEAGDRSAALTLNLLFWHVEQTTDRRAAARRWLDNIRAKTDLFGHLLTIDAEPAIDEVLESPYLAFGTPDQIADHLRQTAVESGITYFSFFPTHIAAFQPALELLKT